MEEKFPEEASRFSGSFGLVPFDADRGGGARRGSVVLVHGLDDPGKVWRSLAPALREQGFDVWLMEYPNDQPIVESAALLFEELRGLRQGGVERIALVAHSMGGLVSREMLTSPGVDMLIVAGVASPWTEGQIGEWIDGLRQDADEDQAERLDELDTGLVSLTRGLGDGLVSVESTRLEGVEHLTVDGTHLSMIRNVFEGSERVPPAVPIIVDRLVVVDESGPERPLGRSRGCW